MNTKILFNFHASLSTLLVIFHFHLVIKLPALLFSLSICPLSIVHCAFSILRYARHALNVFLTTRCLKFSLRAQKFFSISTLLFQLSSSFFTFIWQLTSLSPLSSFHFQLSTVICPLTKRHKYVPHPLKMQFYFLFWE